MALQKLTWYEPRWAYRHRLWLDLRQLVNVKSLVRITLGTAIASGAVIAGFKWAVPQMVLPNLLPVVIAIPAIALMFVLQSATLMLIPPMVTIRTNKILWQHGQSARIIDPQNVTATFLTFHSSDRIRLRLCYMHKGKSRSRVIGVPPTVDFNLLSDLLPVAPMVRDARGRIKRRIEEHR
jgi:hypothetical protein